MGSCSPQAGRLLLLLFPSALCRVNDAVAKAKEEWHHYTHCLELVG
jgi:hypothetical protein